jgi:uncharacterized protein
MSMASGDIVEELQRALVGRPEVRLSLLFGSRARGRETPGSDLDLAVSAEPLDRLTLIHDLSAALGLSVDVIDLDRAGYFLLEALLRDGVVVYERDRHAAAEWRTRAILEVETDRPNFERMRDAFLRKTAAADHGRP